MPNGATRANLGGGGVKNGISERQRKKLLDPTTWDHDGRLIEVAAILRKELGEGVFEDHNLFRKRVDAVLTKYIIKLSATDLKAILKAVSWRVETAPPVISKVHKAKVATDPLHGLFSVELDGKPVVVEYEPDSDLRDTEQVPLLEEGGIEAFIQREVLPYAPDAWFNADSTKIGYGISFTRYFYTPPKMRTLEEIKTDILAIESETSGLLDELLKGGQR